MTDILFNFHIFLMPPSPLFSEFQLKSHLLPQSIMNSPTLRSLLILLTELTESVNPLTLHLRYPLSTSF